MPSLAQRAHTASMVGIWVFVLSDAVGFAALLTTMAALRVGAAGFGAGEGPSMATGLLATAILVGISASLIVARGQVRSQRRTKIMAFLAMLLSFGFCALQVWEYQDYLEPTLLPGQESFVVVTGYHLLHVAAGGLALLWGLTRKTLPLGPLSVYWHFVDGLWLIIFAFYYLL